MEKIAYLHSRTIPGYGARIFIPYALLTGPVDGCMRHLSMWGGSDKDTGKCKGFEFGDREYKIAQDALKNFNFKLEEIQEKNANDVWA